MEHIVCDLCENEKADQLYSVTDFRYRGKQPFDLVKCTGCDLIYLNPQPTALELKPYYEKYYSPAAIEHDSKKEIYSGIRHDDVKRLRKYKQKGRILDVGCGRGEFLAKVIKKGWQAVGIEMNPNAARYARESNKLEVHETEFSEVHFSSKSFDVVRLHHVIEHLHTPSSALSKIHNLLKDDGLLILACPNFNKVNQLLFADKWDALDIPRHLYQFNVKTLNKLAYKAGFEAIDVYHSQWFQNFVVFKKSFLNKLNAQELSIAQENLNRIENKREDKGSVKLLKWIFNLSMVLLASVQGLLRSGGTIEVYYRKRV